MEHGQTQAIVETLIFFSAFLGFTGFLQVVTKKIAFPYTVSLLIFGFLASFLVQEFSLPVTFHLSPDWMYYLLLPLLLFESSYHMNIHQFRLQFKTISFLSTFGLLISITVVGIGVAQVVGIGWEYAFLFGAIISATDPIAVLALFKNLGGPKRLSLLADGESMFNDATAVIAYDLILAFIMVHSAPQIADVGFGLFRFFYVFLGSMLFGAVIGYLTGLIINRLFEERVVETTLTIVLALMGFIVAEHFLQLSGVITTVFSGLVLGNVGKTKFSGSVVKFMEELWDYISFLAVSLIFFFAAFNLDWDLVFSNEYEVIWVILIVLSARALSIYMTFAFTNWSGLFANEPNVPLSWQHVLNWGGLKGVIPLVLVYSLPSDIDQEIQVQLQRFTLVTLLFSLFVNGITIKWLLLKLRLHLPGKEEEIIRQEMNIFEIEEARARLKKLPKGEFDREIITESDHALEKEEVRSKNYLLKIATPHELLRSLRLQAIEIERGVVDGLFQEGHIDEGVYYEFHSELDLQQDAIEYPQVSQGRGYESGGKVNKRESFRIRMEQLAEWMQRYPIFRIFLSRSKNRVVEIRFKLLKTRIIAANAVFEYLDHVSSCMMKHLRAIKAIDTVRQERKRMYRENKKQLAHMRRRYPSVAKSYQENIIYKVVCKERILWH